MSCRATWVASSTPTSPSSGSTRATTKAWRTGPYVFGDLNSPALQDWVTHFPYQEGLLISYWDTRLGDNNTSTHPGLGLILPIDAHPTPLAREAGVSWSSRYQSFDSPFGLERTTSCGCAAWA